MEPVAKRPSRAGGGGSAAGDRLSALPDGLLHAVMSFLPAPGKPCRPACSPRDAFRIDTGMDLMNPGHFRHVDRWIRGGMKYCPQVVDIHVGICLNLVIIAPRLVSLRLLIRVRDGTVSLYGVNSLVEASIDVSNCQMSPSGEAMLLGALFSATNLELKGTRAMAILDEELDKFPLFNNLRNLSLHCCLRDKGIMVQKYKFCSRKNSGARVASVYPQSFYMLHQT
uniref:F-box domain-containing protein n=1 Tax=Oryza glumipatula TaxID=40148 RepID=A0A0D9ZL48_9ORYZ